MPAARPARATGGAGPCRCRPGGSAAAGSGRRTAVVARAERGARAVTAAVAGEGVYQPLPEITADLRSPSPQLHYVQLAAVIEIAEGDAAALQAQQQPIIADLQRALRELGRQELAGAAGSERVRALFTRIIEQHLAPARVRSVLFTRFLVD